MQNSPCKNIKSSDHLPFANRLRSASIPFCVEPKFSGKVQIVTGVDNFHPNSDIFTDLSSVKHRDMLYLVL